MSFYPISWIPCIGKNDNRWRKQQLENHPEIRTPSVLRPQSHRPIFQFYFISHPDRETSLLLRPITESSHLYILKRNWYSTINVKILKLNWYHFEVMLSFFRENTSTARWWRHGVISDVISCELVLKMALTNGHCSEIVSRYYLSKSLTAR